MDLIREHRGFFIFESILFIVLGIIAIIVPSVFTFSFELLVGVLFIFGGLVQGFRTFQARGAMDIFTSIISCAFYLIIGILLLSHPVVGVLSITLLISILFFVQGILQLWWAFSVRSIAESRWGFWVFSGLVSIGLALLVWFGWPTTAVWFIGLLIGVNFLFFGFSQLFIALDAK